jgi:hypothetical protein
VVVVFPPLHVVHSGGGYRQFPPANVPARFPDCKERVLASYSVGVIAESTQPVRLARAVGFEG